MTLDRFLAESRFTQVTLATKAGLHQSTVSRLAAGRMNASISVALRIEQASSGIVRAEHLPMSPGTRASLKVVRKLAA